MATMRRAVCGRPRWFVQAFLARWHKRRLPVILDGLRPIACIGCARTWPIICKLWMNDGGEAKLRMLGNGGDRVAGKLKMESGNEKRRERRAEGGDLKNGGDEVAGEWRFGNRKWGRRRRSRRRVEMRKWKMANGEWGTGFAAGEWKVESGNRGGRRRERSPR